MEIYLIRHTTPDIEKGICYGQSDIPLTDSFVNESVALKEHLPDDFDLVLSSPLIRCTSLANSISTVYNTDDRLKELSFGDWELKPWNSIPQKEMTPWMSDFVTTPPPNGESYQDLSIRLKELMEELKLKQYDTVAIISHAGPIRAMIANTIGLPLKDSFKLQIDYGSISCINFSEFEDQLVYMNKK
ncbi:MAG: alpha-ribazole phosphatase [Reichenbachiella sp.]